MSELQATLDMEKGGAIAASLDKLYVYIIGRSSRPRPNRTFARSTKR